LLFVEDLVLLAPSQQGLQHSLVRLSVAHDQAGMKISNKNNQIFCLSRYPRQCSESHYTYGRGKEIHAGIGKADVVLRELYRLVITQRELPNTAKLSAFQLVFVPILNHGYTS